MTTYKALAAAALLAIGASAQAVTITGLNNTGAGLTAGQQDTNYALSVNFGNAPTTGYGIVTTGTGFPFPIWLPNDATSKWIAPAANITNTAWDQTSPGQYTYTTTFDLSGFNASTASFSGRVLADNGVGVYLNGHLLTQTANEMSLNTWANFTSQSGANFVNGLNTIQFVVNNVAVGGPNPTGLRVEFTSSNVAAVPEPETWAMMLAGIAAVGFVARRRKAA